MKKWEIDVAVLLIFFCRDDKFEKVFDAVKKARPRVLLLYQDGPRKGKNDLEKIAACRRIAENIDWECEVHKKYQDENVGCDPSGFIAHSWALSVVDKCIILEDDVVPNQCFFYFCKELLDKYEHDERINMICGMNNTRITPNSRDSYFFSHGGSIWGWATWRRCMEKWDPEYRALDDDAALKRIRENYIDDYRFNRFIKMCRKHKASGKAHFETINALAMYLNNSLNIVPKYNMISNIGVSQETTHGQADLKLYPKRVRKLLYMDTYDMEFPLSHPEYVVNNREYQLQTTFSRMHQLLIFAEGCFYSVMYQGCGGFLKRAKNKIKKIIKK